MNYFDQRVVQNEVVLDTNFQIETVFKKYFEPYLNGSTQYFDFLIYLLSEYAECKIT